MKWISVILIVFSQFRDSHRMIRKHIFKFIILVLILTVDLYADWVNVLYNIPIVNTLTATGNYVFAGTNVTFQGGGVYRSSNNGYSWELVHFSTTLSLSSSSNYIYRGYQNGFSYSSNYGTDWIIPGGNSRWILSLLSDGNFVYQGCFTISPTTNTGVWVSTNNGLNFTQSSLNDINVYCLTKSGNYLFAGGYTFGIGSGVFVSTNNGANWTNPLTTGGDGLASNGNFVYTGTSSSGIYRSTNYGQTWSQTSLNNISVNVIEVYGSNVFVGGGFWHSTDNGTTWMERTEGFGTPYGVYTLCISNDYIYAGTSFGIWRRPLSELVGINSISEETPAAFVLSQNYPNPFNPVTNIKFEIPKSGFVKISVFDILGREITVLLNEQLQPGSYIVDWDASHYPSGVYFYQLETVEIVETKKMVLIK